MMESVKKVEATREKRMGTEPRRLSAEEKDALLKEFHPDYNPDAFAQIKVGPNKGQKVPKELGHLLHSNSRLLNHPIDLNKIDYDVDVLLTKKLKSHSVKLINRNTGKGIEFDFTGFKALGIWTPPKKHAPFVCIEPWQSLPGPENDPQAWTERAAAACLAPGQHWATTLSTTFER